MRHEKYDPEKQGRYRLHGKQTPTPVNTAHCVCYVWRSWDGGQCHNARKPETRDGEWCLQHCPDRNAEKQAAKAAKRTAERERGLACDIARARAPYEEALAAFDAWAESGDKYSLRDALCALADKAEADRVEGAWWRE